MNKSTHKYSEAVEAFAQELDRLDAATAHAVIEEARQMAQDQWLRLQIRIGEESGEPLDGPTVMAELLAEAEADIKSAQS